jgi:hypothetical protein
MKYLPKTVAHAQAKSTSEVKLIIHRLIELLDCAEFKQS